MPAYDSSRFDPPASVVLVTVRRTDNGEEVAAVPMLMDTGADISLVPEWVIEALQIEPSGESVYELENFIGETIVTAAVFLDVVFCQRRFRGQYVSIEQEWGILGRNVLNTVPLLLNGPALE
jgi:hypothetical protein